MYARSVIWVGFNGDNAITRINSIATAPTTMAAIVGCSHADDFAYWEGIYSPNGAPAPTVGDYGGTNSRAQLVFACADGTAATLIVVAPKRSIFMADGTTVDPTNADVVSLVAAAVVECCNAAGSPFTALIIGTLGKL